MYKVPFKVIFLSNQCRGDWKVDLSPPASPSFSLNHTRSGFSCFIAGRFHLCFRLKRKGVLGLNLLDLFSRLYSSQRHQAQQVRKQPHGHHQYIAIHPNSVGPEFIRKNETKIQTLQGKKMCYRKICLVSGSFDSVIKIW